MTIAERLMKSLRQSGPDRKTAPSQAPHVVYALDVPTSSLARETIELETGAVWIEDLRKAIVRNAEHSRPHLSEQLATRIVRSLVSGLEDMGPEYLGQVVILETPSEPITSMRTGWLSEERRFLPQEKKRTYGPFFLRQRGVDFLGTASLQDFAEVGVTDIGPKSDRFLKAALGEISQA